MFKCNPIFCNIKLLYNTPKRYKNNDVPKSEVRTRRIVNLNRENKLLFGKLIESKREKSKRIPDVCSDSDIIVNNNKADRDSEAFWFKHLSASTVVKTLSVPSVAEEPNFVEKHIISTKQSNLEIKPPVTKNIVSRENPNTTKGKQKLKYGPKKLLLKEIREKSNGNKIINKKENEIPFSKTLLQAMTRHPLLKQKNFVYSVAEDVKQFRLPSVSRVLSGTMPESSREALILWKKKQILLHGEEKFKEIQQEHLRVGRDFHGSIQHFFETGSPTVVEGAVEGCWNSVKTFLKKVDLPELIEAPVTHPNLGYLGIIDCVANYNGNLTLIEWKKSERHKKTVSATFDAPVQLAAYLGALGYDPRYQTVSDSVKAKNIDENAMKHLNCSQGLVVVAYTDGSMCDVHEIDLERADKYWRLWLRRLQEYWIRYRDGTLQEPI